MPLTLKGSYSKAQGSRACGTLGEEADIVCTLKGCDKDSPLVM